MGTLILPVSPPTGGLPDAYRRSGTAAKSRVIHTNVSRETYDRTLGRCRHAPYTFGALLSSSVRVGPINYLTPLLAIIVGIVHASIAPVIVVGSARPNLVLVAVVLVTALGGFLPGITWAFAAGLTANLLVGEPLGTIPFALLIVAAIVAGGQRLIGRSVWIYPVVAAFVGSIVGDVVSLGLSQLVADASIGPFPSDLVIAAAVLNTVVATLLLLPARAIAARTVPDEAATAW